MNSSLWTATKESTPSLVKVLNLKPTKTAWEPLEYFFQHFIPPVFFPLATLINPPFPLLQIWQPPDPLSLILHSSFIVIKSRAVSPWQECEICQGEAIKVTTDWNRPGEQQSKLRVGLQQNSLQLRTECSNCEPARRDWWSVAASCRYTERLSESLSYRHLLNPDGMQRNSFIPLQLSTMEKLEKIVPRFNHGSVGFKYLLRFLFVQRFRFLVPLIKVAIVSCLWLTCGNPGRVWLMD